MLFMIPLSLAMALTIRVGHVYGEGDLVRLRQVRRLGWMAATGLALLTMLMIGVFRHDMARAYTPDADVQAIAAQLLLFALAYQLFDAWQVSAAGILRGLQDTRGPMWITLFCYWVVALPLGVWLARGAGYGANGFWLGLVLGLVLASVLLAWRLHWRQKQLLLDAHSPAFAVKP
jgi:MATE family multidrug resistance protein